MTPHFLNISAEKRCKYNMFFQNSKSFVPTITLFGVFCKIGILL